MQLCVCTLHPIFCVRPRDRERELMCAAYRHRYNLCAETNYQYDDTVFNGKVTNVHATLLDTHITCSLAVHLILVVYVFIFEWNEVRGYSLK